MNAQSPPHIAILGGGPAASATALSLLQHVSGPRPALSMIFPTPRADRPAIGETVPPAATQALRELGLPAVLNAGDHLECPGSLSVWGADTPGYNDFLLDPIGRAYHLDRWRFDNELRNAAAAQGCVLQSGWRLRGVRALAPGYELTLQADGGGATRAQHADFVIDASGIGAAFARRLGIARNLVDEVIALCALIPVDTRRHPAHTLIEAVADGWWYAARLPGDRAIISLTTDAPTLQAAVLTEPANWLAAFQGTHWLAGECRRQFGTAPTEPAAIHLKPMPSAILSGVVGPDWLAVGDAASSYDAMSSAGITKALRHGQQAGRAVAAWLADSRRDLGDYQERVFRDFSTYLELHQQHYRAEARFADRDFWQRRRLGRQSS